MPRVKLSGVRKKGTKVITSWSEGGIGPIWVRREFTIKLDFWRNEY